MAGDGSDSDKQRPDALVAATVEGKCMDCNESFSLDQLQKYGNYWKCAFCHSSYRFCRDNVANWVSLSAESKQAYIIANRGKGGRGKKRELVSVECVEMNDYKKNDNELEFLNEVRFKKRGRKWYDWDATKAQQEWDRVSRDKSYQKSTDSYGNVTVAALQRQRINEGRAVGSKRSLERRPPIQSMGHSRWRRLGKVCFAPPWTSRRRSTVWSRSQNQRPRPRRRAKEERKKSRQPTPRSP